MQVEIENNNIDQIEQIDLDKINALIKKREPLSVFKNNVKKFFKLFGFPYDSIMAEQDGHFQNEVKQNVEENARYKKVSDGFDKYLDHDLWKLSIELIDNGYTPSLEQKRNLFKLLSNIVSNDPVQIVEITQILKKTPSELITAALINTKEDVKNNGEEFSNKKSFNFIKLYSNLEYEKQYSEILGMINNELNNHTDNLLFNLVIEYKNLGSIGTKNHVKITKYLSNVSNTFEFVKENHSKIEIEDVLQYKKTLFDLKDKFMKVVKKFSPDENHKYYAENIRDLKIIFFDDVFVNLNKIIEKKFSENKEFLINQARQLNTDKFLDNKINTSVVEHILSVERELPIDAQNLLKTINDKYYSATKANALPEDVKHEIANLYENRLPEVLKKFMVIDPEYRIELKNVQGKNAEQLMLESLKNIEEVLDNQIKATNEARLSDLSVTQRYTSAVKNKF